MRYEARCSSSRTYVQAPSCVELDVRLDELFGRRVLVVPCTTVGHPTALPVLIGSHQALIIDPQVHHGVREAVNHLPGRERPSR